MSVSNNDFVRNFSEISYKSGLAEFYSDGTAISNKQIDKRFKKITYNEIAAKITEYLKQKETPSPGSESNSVVGEIRDYEKLKNTLTKMYKNEQSSFFKAFKNTKPLKTAIGNVNEKLNELCKKAPFEEADFPKVPINPGQNPITKTILGAYNLDFDRTSDDIPLLLGQNSLESLILTIEDMKKILDASLDFDEHEKYTIRQTLSQLSHLSYAIADLYVASPSETEDIMNYLLEKVDSTEGVLIPGLLEEHFVILSIRREEGGTYQFKITNAGEGIFSFHNQKLSSGLRFETTLVFSGLPKEKVCDAAFLSQLAKRLPANDAYGIIERHFGKAGDPISQDAEDLRKPQLRGTCATRTIQKWIHQEFYEKGCETAYRRIRHERALFVKERLASIKLESLSKNEIDQIGKEIMPNQEGVDLKKILAAMQGEQNKIITRRAEKLKDASRT